jgi:AbrB family looped-hinge helix DNA binding protein
MVTFNGRITLPPNVRKQLGLKTGDSVEFVELDNGHFAIAPGAGSIPASITEARGWIPQLDFSPTADEPRFEEEMDEAIH